MASLGNSLAVLPGGRKMVPLHQYDLREPVHQRSSGQQPCQAANQ